MRTTLLLTFLLIYSISNFSQSEMSVKPDFWSGKAIYQDGKKLSISNALEIAKNNSEVIKNLKSARTNRTIGDIIAYPGAIAFGYTLGLSLNSHENAPDPNWGVGGIGAGMMVGGMILQGNGNKKLKEAVRLYNSSLNGNSNALKPELNIIYSENGLGISVNF